MIYPKSLNINLDNFQKALNFSKDLIQIINSVEIVLCELNKFKNLTSIIQPLLNRLINKSLSEIEAKKNIIRLFFFYI